MSEQLGYAHEMGHIPHLEKPRDDFLEYSEALPIFFEYLSALNKKNNPDDALDYFLSERLPIEQDEARDMMKIFKNMYVKDEMVKLYHHQLFVDYYKFFESFEYALQLIDRMKDDKDAVSKEIEKVIDGYSLVDTASNLEIETDGCKRLLQEYKRMSR